MSSRTDPYDQPGSLMQATVALLKERDLVEVSAETKISFFWLRKFVAGVYKNPSVNRVQFLYEYLSEASLDETFRLAACYN